MSILRSSMDHRVKPGGDEWRVKPGDDESLRCRDAPSHPSFAKKTPRKAKPRNSSLKKKGGGAPRGAPPGRIEKGCGARPFSFPPYGRTEVAGTSWSGRARLSAPHRGIRGFETSARLRPRFLEPPDANGRTLSGTSAASTSRSGTRRTGRCPSRPRAQCIATPTRTAPAPP
jgi:hypothetical protein